MIRILQIIASPAIGGIERQVLSLLQKYDRKRFSIDVACGKSVDGSLRDEYLAADTRLILCRWSKFVFPFVGRLFRLLQRERYDVIHARLSEVSGAAMLAARLANVPIRVASYEHTQTAWRNPGFMNRRAVALLKWLNLRFATRILGVSEACLDTYYPDWKERRPQFQVSYNGVALESFSEVISAGDVRREFDIPADALVVGHVGSFREPKNHHTIVKIAACLCPEIPNLYFLLVGDGHLRDSVEHEVDQCNLRPRFIFTGNRPDVVRLLGAMDVFVMPSIFEGFGVVAIEAQLGQVPVVASNVPGIQEALAPVFRKFSRDPLDFRGLAEQIRFLLQHHSLRHQLSQEARDYVSNTFSITKTVEQLQSIYSMASADIKSEV